jgi:hypothetical protein
MSKKLRIMAGSVLFALALLVFAVLIANIHSTNRNINFDVESLKNDLTIMAVHIFAPESVEQFNQARYDWQHDPRMPSNIHANLFWTQVSPLQNLTEYDLARRFHHHFTAFGYARNQSDNIHRILISFSIQNAISCSVVRIDLEFLINDHGEITWLYRRRA